MFHLFTWFYTLCRLSVWLFFCCFVLWSWHHGGGGGFFQLFLPFQTCNCLVSRSVLNWCPSKRRSPDKGYLIQSGTDVHGSDGKYVGRGRKKEADLSCCEMLPISLSDKIIIVHSTGGWKWPSAHKTWQAQSIIRRVCFALRAIHLHTSPMRKGFWWRWVWSLWYICERVLLALSVCWHGKGHDVSMFP